jgi:hypothetical protein
MDNQRRNLPRNRAVSANPACPDRRYFQWLENLGLRPTAMGAHSCYNFENVFDWRSGPRRG